MQLDEDTMEQRIDAAEQQSVEELAAYFERENQAAIARHRAWRLGISHDELDRRAARMERGEEQRVRRGGQR
jgi:hypothetical protein